MVEASPNAANSETDAAQPARPSVMRCRDCNYDLRGVPAAPPPTASSSQNKRANPSDFDNNLADSAAGVDPPAATEPEGYPSFKCPECGRTFMPGDPTSYRSSELLDRPALRRYLLRRGLPMIVLIVAVTAGVLFSWIPFPAPMAPQLGVDDWRTWIWLGDRYGWDAVGADTEVYRWDDQPRRFREYEPVLDEAGDVVGRDLAWEVARLGDDDWRIRVTRDDVSWGAVLQAWNATRDRLFGLRQRGPIGPGVDPFVVRGTEAEALTAMVRAWNADIQTDAPLDPEAEAVWLWHPEQRRVMETPIDDAEAIIGYDPRDVDHPAHPRSSSPFAARPTPADRADSNGDSASTPEKSLDAGEKDTNDSDRGADGSRQQETPPD